MLHCNLTCNPPQAATHALYHLAEKPALLVPLREEIEASIAVEGWTAAALSKMWKLDSLLRETLRSHQTSLRTYVLTELPQNPEPHA